MLIAALSHLAGGGSNPGVLGVVLSLAFAFLASAALAGRRLSTLRLSIAVGLSQFVFHVLFSLGAALPRVSASPAGAGSPSMLGMVMSGGRRTTLPTLTGGSPIDTMAGMSDASMWAGHALAAVVTIALLLHGGRSFTTLVRLARERLRLVVAVVLDLPEAAAERRHVVMRVLADRRGVRPTSILLTARPHRGPPVAA
ncbi:hypothetical protein GCM10025780_24900 [Frondihabitans cladoniiphilus]|uniref:Uncharacterized protein n=1 Tax=Frondihabitans cladoniiphilus TaxID=715785 RepID=A0ABP8W1Q8_9MICO